uniref:C2H2-type domain-containing protein n=1 Tax=Acrobeloides nanus TaxID=290746 RepID=A0A914EA99_9BILA
MSLLTIANYYNESDDSLVETSVIEELDNEIEQELNEEEFIGDIPVDQMSQPIEVSVSQPNEYISQPTEEPISQLNEELISRTNERSKIGIMNLIATAPKVEAIDTFKSIQIDNFLYDSIQSSPDEPGSSTYTSQEIVSYTPKPQEDLEDERGSFDKNPCSNVFIVIESIPEEILAIIDMEKIATTPNKNGRKRKKSWSPVNKAKQAKVHESPKKIQHNEKENKNTPKKIIKKEKKKLLKEILKSNSAKKNTEEKFKKKSSSSYTEQGPSNTVKKSPPQQENTPIKSINISRQDLEEMTRTQMAELLKSHGHKIYANQGRGFYKKQILLYLEPEQEKQAENPSANRKSRNQPETGEPDEKSEQTSTPSTGRKTRSGLEISSPGTAPTSSITLTPVQSVTNSKRGRPPKAAAVTLPNSAEAPKNSRDCRELINLRDEVEKYKKQAEKYKKLYNEAVHGHQAEKTKLEARIQELASLKEALFNEIVQLKSEKQSGASTSNQISLSHPNDVGLNSECSLKSIFTQLASQLQMPLRELTERIERMEEKEGRSSMSTRSLQEDTPSPDSLNNQALPGVISTKMTNVSNYGNPANRLSLIPIDNGGTNTGYVMAGASNSPTLTVNQKSLHFCPICSAGYSNKKQLKEHISVHQALPASNEIKCEYCNAAFDVQSHYEAHVTYCSQTKPIKE